MAINLSAPRATELKPRIVVFGVGGAGGNAVNNMIEAGLEGVEFVVANTDAQQLQFAKTDRRIQLGVAITQGLGAGAHPEVGMSAAEESIPEIGEHLESAHMVFITAGMGGGTGTGAAPIIAKAARERGILTVGVVTKPFHFEGRHRMRMADAGVNELQRCVDTLIVIPNQNLFRIANERTTFAEAFGMADQVLHSGVRSITDLMVLPGLINLDFADVRSVMSMMGKAMMGTGEATGEDRALQAAQNAIANPLLDEVSLKGAKAVLINVTGGLDMTLLEVDEAANAISSEVDSEANIIFGAAFDPSLEGKIRVSVVATGMESEEMALPEPARQTLTRAAAQPAAPVRSTASPARQLEQARSVGFARMAATPAAAPAAPTPEPVITSSEPAEPLLWQETPKAEPKAETKTEAPAAEPVAAESKPAEPTVRIIDPAVDDTPEALPSIVREPLAAPSRYAPTGYQANRAPPSSARTAQPATRAADTKHKGGGLLSMFGGGRSRNEAPLSGRRSAPAPAPTRAVAQGGAAQAVAQSAPEPHDATDDLDIPSFLRRLAN